METPSAALQQIVEYRGVKDLVCAKVLTDDDENGYTTGDVIAIAGVAEISKTVDSSSEAHYYDNIPAVVIQNTSADTVTISASAIPLNVLAYITGQDFDDDTGTLIEGERDFAYFAIGYKTKKTNGDEIYVWRFKGTFNVPDQTNTTENDGTDANGQEIVYTGISTTHKFDKTGKGAKAINTPANGDANVSTFFNTVTTPDTLTTKTARTVTITQATDTVVTVKKGNTTIANNGTVYDGDVLTITCTGGTITVNGTAFTSGNTLTVSANVAVVSTKAN